MAGKPDSTRGATSPKEGGRAAMAEVGGVRSSDDPMLDLWFGENLGERRDATCSAVEKRNEGRGDGLQELPAPKKVRQLQITLYRKATRSDRTGLLLGGLTALLAVVLWYGTGAFGRAIGFY